MKFYFFTLAFLGAIHFGNAQTLVNTQFGPIQGSANGNVLQFLGVPFAKPPVGNLRWKAPEEPATWASALPTTSFAPECPQKKFQQGGSTFTLTGNEDCLYLNIWTPQTGPGTRPVLVFIHGGGNQQGSASEVNGGTQMFFGKNMAERGDAVVVTIQYRLGPLGFLAHPGLEPETTNNTSGNYAILDQILALRWIKTNISKFGGDSTKVMIFGESAGGLNVGNLLHTPLASGLFQRACIQSAVPVVGSYTDVKNAGIAFANTYTTSGTDVQKIAFLRSLPSDSIIKDETAPLSGGAVGMNWLAAIDNYVFYNTPLTNIQNGTYNKVPLMIGSNSEEMSLSAPQTVLPGMVTLLINGTVPASLQTQATALYPPGTTTTQARASYIGILTDAQFTSTTRRLAQCVSVNQNEPVWRYFFTHKHSIAALSSLGSYHGMELFYVFNTWENATLGSGPFFSAQDDSVQKVMVKYWTNFARTGNPNETTLPAWPQYQGVTDCYLEIKSTPRGNQCGLRTAQSDLWDGAVNYQSCVSTLGVASMDLEESVSIVPNPTQGIINLKSTSPVSNIRIINTNGSIVLLESQQQQLNLEPMPAGIYLLLVKFEDGSVVCKKIIKY